MKDMASTTATAKSQSQFTFPFDVKWSTTTNNNNGDIIKNHSSKHQRTRKFGDSEEDNKKRSRNFPIVSSGPWIEKKSDMKKTILDHHRLKKTTASDRLIEKKSILDHHPLIQKSAIGCDRLIQKSQKKAKLLPDRLISIEKSEKKAMAPSDRLVEIENSEEKLEGSDVKSVFLIGFKANNKLDDGAAEELQVKTWNLRPRKPLSKKPYENGGTSGGALLQETNKMPQSPQSVVAGGVSKTKNETTRAARTHADAKIVQSKEAKKQRFSISLSKEEIEEDVFVMTGSKPARRPKKRPRNVQKQLDSVFPGLWLSSITPDSYKVVENLPKG